MRRDTWRQRLAWWLQKWADRISPETAPRAVGWSFTIEEGRGIVFREGDRQGCPLWYFGEYDYQRAHDEADTEHTVVMWRNIVEGREPKTRRAGGAS